MPTEVPHTPTKLFYKQELFLSTVDGTHPIVAIVGKCAVLDYGEYICSEYIHYLMFTNEIHRRNEVTIYVITLIQVDRRKFQRMMYISANHYMTKAKA